jgi:hypothetical protein
MYFGFDEGENGYALLQSPAIQDYLFFDANREFTGVLYMIDAEGTWHTMPGNDFCYDEDNRGIYSFVPAECGGCTVGMFDLDTHELLTKESHGGDVPWKKYSLPCYYDGLFREEDGIRWNRGKE